MYNGISFMYNARIHSLNGILSIPKVPLKFFEGGKKRAVRPTSATGGAKNTGDRDLERCHWH